MTDNICDKDTFKKVYFQHADHLRNFLYYKCGDLQLSEDLAQDAYTKLWEKCSQVVRDKAKSFLFTIANNLFLNTVKHQKVVLKFQQLSYKDKKNIQDPQYLMEADEFKAKLEKAISDLPETQREVFLMNRVDKLKYREIAEALGVSVKAVEKRMHKALKVLKEIIS